MAERTPFEDAMRRAYDANMRYWETVGRATTDYMQAVTKLWTEAPLTWTPGARSPSRPGAGEWGDPHAPALLLEGAAGSEARAVVMLSNDLGREVEAAVVASTLVGPNGETVGLRLRTEPDMVRLLPGTRVPVTLMVDVADTLSPGVDYRCEVNVPGLSPRGVPVIVRRRV